MNANSLNKDTILKHTTCNDIYIKFLHLDQFPKSNISSPFSTDNRASFKIYANGDFKCFSTGKQGDVWQFVAELANLDSKTQFKEVLQLVADEINMFVDYNCNNDDLKLKQRKQLTTIANSSFSAEILHNCNIANQTIAKDHVAKKLNVNIREFTENDLQFWKTFDINVTVLKKYKVNSIASYCWSGKTPINTKKECVAFAFELNGNFKLYIPEQTAEGIKKNVLPPFPNNEIFGLKQLTGKVQNLIICEGEKDTLVANSKGFNAITFGSGSIHSKKENIKILQELCEKLFVCYDADETGITGMQNLIKLYPEIIQLQLPKNETIKGYDIADFFQEHNAQDFQKVIDLAVKNKMPLALAEVTKEKWTKFHEIEKYLSEKYDFRYNIIATDIEISEKNQNKWKTCNEDSLWLELQKKSIQVGKNQIVSILKSDFVQEFNPLLHYFVSLPKWDCKTDYIFQFSRFINLNYQEDKEQFEYHFKKWCVRAVKCATMDNYYNKQAFILSDNGKGQNIGKTFYMEFLTPALLSDYQQKDLPKDNKDAKIALAKNFIINLDELAYLQKNEVNSLKSLFSETKIKVRLPYGSKDTIVQRVANFVGSTNNVTFLNDETGSVRWLIFIIDSIDQSYSKNFNIDKLWAQAFWLSKDKNFDEILTKEDIANNEIRNEKFQIPTPEKELIHKYFGKPENSNIEYYTSTDVLNEISKWTTLRLNSIMVGRALTALKFNRVKHNDIYCYEVQRRFYDTN